MPHTQNIWGKTVDEALQQYQTDIKGLSEQEVSARRSEAGFNELPPSQSRPAILRFLAQFHNVLIYVLILAATITGFLQHWLDMGVILGVVVANAFIGFIQEGKAEQALRSMSKLLVETCTVIRNGKKQSIPVRELIPGDIIQIQAGDKIPADVRLLESKQLAADESLLTGESLPVEKQLAPVATDAGIGDRTNMAFSGTLITRGSGLGLVTSIGQNTELGHISRLLDSTQTAKTPLLARLDTFAKIVSLVLFVGAAATMLFGIFVRGLAVEDMFIAAVGLFVAAIPEGLLAIITITLAVGVRLMAKNNAVVRKLPAVESLGAVTVICTDKTGTLTKNAMTVTQLLTVAETFTVSGTGYDPHGQILRDDKTMMQGKLHGLDELIRGGVLCNDATLLPPNSQGNTSSAWQIIGDPTEGALLVSARKYHMEPEQVMQDFPRTDTLPFSSEAKYMATLHHDHHGKGFIVMKGAPEIVLNHCEQQMDADGTLTPLERQSWEERIEERAKEGERTLGIAILRLHKPVEQLTEDMIHDNFIFLGCLSIIDPPREEAASAVADCYTAGITVKMITGDHATTASSIAAQVGIHDADRVATGVMIESTSDEDLLKLVREYHVFARVSPEHKLRLVQALQSNGDIVAMTGDGVNDAPALRRADIGVAMGKNGTEVAKEAARIVLLDDRFETIAKAVRAGRTVYDNIIKSIVFILPTSFGEALLIVLAILLGFPLPITAAQILWINLITEASLSLALAFEPAEPDVMERAPRSPKQALLSGQELARLGSATLIMLVLSLAVSMTSLSLGYTQELAQTLTVNVIVLLEIACLFSSRQLHHLVISPKILFGNRYILSTSALVLLLQVALTYVPFMQSIFGTTGMTLMQWIAILGIALFGWMLMELEKLLRLQFRK